MLAPTEVSIQLFVSLAHTLSSNGRWYPMCSQVHR